MNDHNADWYQTKIFSLKDLPSYIIAQVKTLETTSDPTKSPFMKIEKSGRKVNFNDLLEEFEQTKLEEIRNGTCHDWKMSNLKDRIKRFREAIIAANGLQNAARLTNWINSYTQVRSAGTRRNNFNLLKIFLNEYLCPAMAGNSNLVNFPVFIGQIDNMMRRDQKSKKSRHQLVKRATANVLITKEQVLELKNAVTSYLNNKLTDDVEELDKNEFTHVIMNLITMIILRNASRSGTITTMRTEYVEDQNLTYSQNTDRVAMEFAPKSVITARKGPGERERLKVVKKSELNLILKFRDLREKMSVSHAFLFAAQNAPANLTYEQQKIFCRRYHSIVLSQHGFKNMIFNSTIYRKLVTTEVCENIANPQQRLAVHEHIGHWETTAQDHYNMERRKVQNAAFTSTVIEKLIEGGEGEKPAIETSCAIQATSESQLPSTCRGPEVQAFEYQDDDYHYDSDTSDNLSGDNDSEEPEPSEISSDSLQTMCKIIFQIQSKGL